MKIGDIEPIADDFRAEITTDIKGDLSRSIFDVTNIGAGVSWPRARPRFYDPVIFYFEALGLAPGESREIGPVKVLRSKVSAEACRLSYAAPIEVAPESAAPFRPTALGPRRGEPPPHAWSTEASVFVEAFLTHSISSDAWVNDLMGPVLASIVAHGGVFSTARSAAGVRIRVRNAGANHVDFTGQVDGFALGDEMPSGTDRRSK